MTLLGELGKPVLPAPVDDVRSVPDNLRYLLRYIEDLHEVLAAARVQNSLLAEYASGALPQGVESLGNLAFYIDRNDDKTGRFFEIYNNASQSGGGGSLIFRLHENGDLELHNGVKILTGTGSPEGAVTAPVGSTFHRSDGGAGTSFYVKESGTGNTGWAAK